MSTIYEEHELFKEIRVPFDRPNGNLFLSFFLPSFAFGRDAHILRVEKETEKILLPASAKAIVEASTTSASYNKRIE